MNQETDIALLNQAVKRIESDIGYIKSDIREIKTENEREFISKAEFKGHEERLSRLERIVFGTIGVIGFGFLGAVITFFIRQPK